MKDPIILCPVCWSVAHKRRYHPGYRCTEPGCPQAADGDPVAGELEVRSLKIALHDQMQKELLAWALNCQEKGPLKCLPSGPTSPAPVIDGLLVT